MPSKRKREGRWWILGSEKKHVRGCAHKHSNRWYEVWYHCSQIDTLNTIWKVKICVEVIVLKSLFGFKLSQIHHIYIRYLDSCILHRVFFET
jgi:hypothetical protein